jgi:hypothetical protein
MYRPIFWAIAVLIAHTATSRGAYIVTFSQVGANVVATGSGSINTTALTSAGTTTTLAPRVTANNAAVALGPAGPNVDVYVGFSGPTQFGTGGQVDASTSSGQRVGIRAGNLAGAIGLFVPLNYVSGQTLSNSSNTWNTTTIAALGLNPGTYTWTWGTGSTSDAFVVFIPAAVPEPSSLVLGCLALVSLGVFVGVRRQLRRCAA